MPKSTTIQARIDPETKKAASQILRGLHISLSEAIGMYLRQIIFHGGIPFDLRLPNKETVRALNEAATGVRVKKFDSVDELFEDLNS